jgi:hypothetical protein
VWGAAKGVEHADTNHDEFLSGKFCTLIVSSLVELVHRQ